jgi:hypothetical protein
MTSDPGGDPAGASAKSQRTVEAYESLATALASFIRGNDQSANAARRIEGVVSALRAVHDAHLEALETYLASVVPAAGDTLANVPELVRLSRDTLHDLGDHELCLHQADWPPAVPNYTHVRVITDRLASKGIPRGAVGTVVEVYGPVVPPATWRSRFRGYEVEVPGAASITVGLSDTEVEAFG